MEDGKAMNKLNVLYEDNHIIVVEKEKNILSQADHTGDIDMLSLVKSYIKEKYKKPGNVYCGLVHRLDRPVGGIMVFARTSKAASRLGKTMDSFQKKYLAVVHGIIQEDEKVVVDYLQKTENGSSVVTNKETGKRAELSFRVLERNREKEETLIEVTLKTGRHHQIRVQLSHLGYPLCGDQRYYRQDGTSIALYAYQLSFVHPTKKERMTFTLLPKGSNYWTDFTLSKIVKQK